MMGIEQAMQDDYIWRKRVTDFFAVYVNFNQKFVVVAAPDELMKEAIKILLENSIFFSPQSLRKSVLKSQGIILPWNLFEEAK